VGTGDNTEGPLGKIADIYRVNPDGTIEALESARVEAAEKPAFRSSGWVCDTLAGEATGQGSAGW
jgi:hypothetical protein